jgi:alanyl-tRNA synthetase
VKQIAALAGGSGGGRPDNAMGGMSDLGKVNDAVAAAQGMIQEMVGA